MKCSARMIGVIYEVLSANVKRPAVLHSANVKRPAGLLLSDTRVAADLVVGPSGIHNVVKPIVFISFVCAACVSYLLGTI